MQVPPLPDATRLHLDDAAAQAQVWWRPAGRWRKRVLPALILAGWLSAWSVGEAMLVASLRAGEGAPVPEAIALVLWTLAGLLVLSLFLGFVLPPRRSKLTLDPIALTWRPGTPATPGPGRWRQAVAPPEPMAIERRAVRAIEDHGDTVRVVAEPPLELGRDLAPEDRAWLAALLRGWAGVAPRAT